MDDQPDDNSAESTLIQSFADFVRSMSSGERPTAATPEGLLTIADAARYLSVSTTTVRNLAVGGKVRSTRVGDRIRFRRAWLDEWIDAGGGEVPVPPPAPKEPQPERAAGRPSVRPVRRRAEPKPKPPTYIQRIGDQELRLLADQGGRRGVYTWHIGVKTALCGVTGHWTSSLKRYPHAYMCPRCLTALAAFPEADLRLFGVSHAFMLRLTYRGKTAALIRAGYHSGDGRRTLCAKKDGPWALTERAPSATECFVCDHRTRWNARDLDPNILTARPLTPMKVLVDAGPIDPRLVDFLERHPQSLDARQAREPLDEHAVWNTHKWQDLHHRGEPIGHFTGQPAPLQSRPDGWLTWTISDSPSVGLQTEDALRRLPDCVDHIERAAVLYERWAKMSPARKRG